MIRAGLAGDDIPRCMSPNIIGHTKYEAVIGCEGRAERVGDEAMSTRGMLCLSYPIQQGVVRYWDAM